MPYETMQMQVGKKQKGAHYTEAKTILQTLVFLNLLSKSL